MSEPNFDELLSGRVDEAKRPVTLPAGTYFGSIGNYKFDFMPYAAKDGSKILGAHFNISFSHAGDDVAAEVTDLGINLAQKGITASYEIGTEREYQLAEMLKGLGIETSGKSWRETVPAAVGKLVMVEVTRNPDKKKPEVVYNRVGKMVGQS
jgi:hypothetical protein